MVRVYQCSHKYLCKVQVVRVYLSFTETDDGFVVSYCGTATQVIKKINLLL